MHFKSYIFRIDIKAKLTLIQMILVYSKLLTYIMN